MHWYHPKTPKAKQRLYWISFYCLFALGTGIYNMFFSTPYYTVLAFISPVFLTIPPLFTRIFGIKPVYPLYALIDIFCFLAFMIGVVYHGYAWIPFYDKAIHFFSGIFFTLGGMCLFYLLKTPRQVERSDFHLVWCFSGFFSMTIAGVWEIFEYFLGLIAHTDPQNVVTTGIHDTMDDMIACLLGTAFLCIFIYRYFRRGKQDYFLRVFHQFFSENIKNRREIGNKK